MRKKIKKISLFILSFLILLSVNQKTSWANDENQLIFDTDKFTRGRIKYADKVNSPSSLTAPADFLRLSGKNVFCVDPFAHYEKGMIYKPNIMEVNTDIHNGNHSFILGEEDKDRFEKIAYYGYYSNPIEENYFYTQAYIWESFKKYPTYFPEPMSMEAYKEYKENLEDKIKDHREKPSWDGKSLQIKVGQDYIFKDEEGALNNLSIPESQDGYSFRIDGDKLIIRAEDSAKDRLDLNFNSKYSNQIGESIIFKSSGYQNLANFKLKKPFTASLKLLKLKANTYDYKLMSLDASTNLPLANIDFEVSERSDFQEKKIISTNEDGVYLGSVERELYADEDVELFIRPAKEVPGYKIASNNSKFIIKANIENRININFNKAMGGISIILKDSESKKPIAGGVYEILKDDKEIGLLKTDSQGKALTSNLSLGKYKLRQKETPKGYYRDGKNYDIVLEKNNELKNIELFNDPINIKLRIFKKDSETGKGIPGVKFVVKEKTSGEVVEFEYGTEKSDKLYQREIITDSEGIGLSRSGLKAGTYILEETRPAKGYIKGEKIEFSIDGEDDKLRKDGEIFIEVKNSITRVKIGNISKANGGQIGGSELSLVDLETNKSVSKWISDDSDGELIKGLEIGKKYRIELLKATEGYKSLGPAIFIVEDTNKIQEVNHYNLLDSYIKTRANIDGKKEAYPSEDTVITDLVEYYNLSTGKEYKLIARLVDGKTGKDIKIDGKPVFVEKIFNANDKESSLKIEFKLDTSYLEGKNLVSFVNIYDGKDLIISHEELDNKDQTVTIKTLNPNTGDLGISRAVILLISSFVVLILGVIIKKRKELMNK